MSEQNDEWLVQRRYLSAESMTLILDGTSEGDESIDHDHLKQATALNAA